MRTHAVMSLLLAALLAAPAVAQTTVATVAYGPLGAATASSAGTSMDAVPAGTPIGGSPANLFLQTSQNAAGYQSATTICYPTQPYQGGIGVNFFERAYARGDAAARAGTVAGGGFAPHSILTTFAAAPGTVGNLILQFRCQTAVGGRTAFALDVDNDGVLDAQGSQGTTVTCPYTFGAAGSVAVRVDNECLAIGNGTTATMYSWTEVWIGFRPDLTASCTIAPYG